MPSSVSVAFSACATKRGLRAEHATSSWHPSQASTGALAIGEDFVDLAASHRDDYGIGVQVVRERDDAGPERTRPDEGGRLTYI